MAISKGRRRAPGRIVAGIRAGISAAALAGCGHVPVASMVELAKVDFATTDFSQLRAAATLPEGLRVQPGRSRLELAVRFKDGATETQSFALREVADPAERAEVAGLGPHATGFRLDAADAARLAEARARVLAAKGAGRRGSFTLAVLPEACRTGELPEGALPVSTFLRTAETRGYVALTRDADLRDLLGPRGLGDIPPCEGT